jgi:hypothetical protein
VGLAVWLFPCGRFVLEVSCRLLCLVLAMQQHIVDARLGRLKPAVLSLVQSAGSVPLVYHTSLGLIQHTHVSLL